MKWIPTVATAMPVIEAPDKPTALAKARALYHGRVLDVQSVASAAISEEERRAIERNRRLGIQDSDEEC